MRAALWALTFLFLCFKDTWIAYLFLPVLVAIYFANLVDTGKLKRVR